MRKKLDSFIRFSKSLYPHEIDYLMSIQNFSKPLNLDILTRIKQAADSQRIPVFDPAVDKRVYSYMKKWIVESLSRIDVDLFFEWLIGTERKVMTDIISPTDEEEIIARMKKIGPTDYYFVKFYELLQYYRDYMMVRNRVKSNIIVSEYLERYRTDYFRSLEVKTHINLLTEHIVNRDTDLSAAPSPDDAEAMLKEIYMDDSLDGHNRHLAVIRLTIHYYNTRRFDRQAGLYAHLDELHKTPLFYSKRILANYYANRTMLHSKLNELPRAEKYGYLSICVENSDYLLYLVNLSVVLIRQGKNAEAYKLMQSSIPKLKNTSNKYYKIGFVSFYIRTLLANGRNEKAVEYALGYLKAYRRDIFEHRWHLFFCACLEALTASEMYSQVLTLCRRNKLVMREKQRIHRADYLPIILYHSLVAEYMENAISREKFISSLARPAKDFLHDEYRSRKIRDLLESLHRKLPDEIRAVREELNREAGKKRLPVP